MPSIDSVILGLLPGSALPGLYKTLIMNMLPNMSQIQKEEVYVSLKKATNKREILAQKQEDVINKYEHISNMIDNDPDGFIQTYDYVAKDQQQQKTGQVTDAKLSQMKQKLDLEALKTQLKSAGASNSNG